jgi:hypothetical protein
MVSFFSVVSESFSTSCAAAKSADRNNALIIIKKYLFIKLLSLALKVKPFVNETA